MLDPLSALGLASNIIQLLQTCGEIASQARAVYNSSSDALPQNEELAAFAKDNKDLLNQISDICGTQQPLTSCEAFARDAAERCGNQATCLLSELRKLEVERSTSQLATGVRAVRQSLRTLAKRKSLESRQRRLQAEQAQLGTALLQLVLRNQTAKFDDITLIMLRRDANDRQGLLLLSDEIKQLISLHQKDLQAHTKEIKFGLDHLESRHDRLDMAIDRHELNLREQLILQSLSFHEMAKRRQNIWESHDNTFEWSFEEARSPLQGWLQRGDGIFWICGKAGSGKSTLMKFLSDDARTQKSLLRWSKDRKLIFVQHYFWYAGEVLEKSHDGMLRSILCQIISAGRKLDILYVLCADRILQDSNNIDLAWSRKQLTKAIESVKKFDKVKVCIFIDGVDEYYPQSEHNRMIAELKLLAETPNIKLCISSRPWTAFTETLGKLSTQMRLEDLTKGDIAQYVRDRLRSAISAIGISPTDARRSRQEELVRFVTQKASGVFLWVYYVVTALEERIAAHNNFEQLLKCVEDFPSELEEYFRQSIFDRINTTWRNETAQALKMAMVLMPKETSDPTMEFDASHNRPQGYLKSFLPFWLLLNGSITTEPWNSTPITYVSPGEVNSMIEATEKYLNACCKDLLCLTRVKHRQPGHESLLQQASVGFLHRTVYDFASTERMDEQISKKAPKSFNEDGFLLKLSLACLKKVCVGTDEPDPSLSTANKTDHCVIFNETISAALLSSPPRKESTISLSWVTNKLSWHDYTAIMKEVDNVGSQYVETMCNTGCLAYWKNATRNLHKLHRLLLRQLIACHHHSYAKAIIQKGVVNWRAFRGDSLLLCALGLSVAFSFPAHEADIDFVEFLLQHGADPNQIVGICSHEGDQHTQDCETLWSAFLRAWIRQTRKPIDDTTKAASEAEHSHIWTVTVLLITNGADLHKTVRGEALPSDKSVFESFHRTWTTFEILRACVPEDYRL